MQQFSLEVTSHLLVKHWGHVLVSACSKNSVKFTSLKLNYEKTTAIILCIAVASCLDYSNCNTSIAFISLKIQAHSCKKKNYIWYNKNW